jgi:hypothetical protein
MNKPFIIIAAFLLAAQFSNAQTSKGDQTLGLYFGLQTISITNTPGYSSASIGPAFKETNSSFSFGPSYSHFVADNVDIGASIGLSSTTDKNADNNFGYPLSYTVYQASAQVYARKYFLLKNKFGIRTGPYMGYEKQSVREHYVAAEDFNNNNSDSHSLYAEVRLELVYYPSPKLGFSVNLANIGYEHSIATEGFQLNQNSDSLFFNGGTSNLQFSMFYVFGGKG